MVDVYITDTSVFLTLGFYYPSRFPTIWKRIDELAKANRFFSVKEVRRELELNCPHPHIEDWLRNNRRVFKTPKDEELQVVAQIFSDKKFQGLVRKSNILKAKPVADPFVVASAKIHDGYVVTQESFKPHGARIPTVCKEFNVECINLEEFLEFEDLKY